MRAISPSRVVAPLVIWLMSGSLRLFGYQEWALRLPSAIAALGTLILTLWFVRKVTGSQGLALGSTILLLLSPGFFGEHGARTGDHLDGPAGDWRNRDG